MYLPVKLVANVHFWLVYSSQLTQVELFGDDS